MKINRTGIITFASFTLLSIILFQIKFCNLRKEIKESKTVISALADSAKIYKDKNGVSHVQIKKLETDRKSLIEIAKQKDAEIAKILKDKDVKTVIKYKYIIQKGDSVLLTDSCAIDTTIGDKWLMLSLKTEGKKLYTNVQVKNELVITDRKVKDKWWKKKYSVIDIANKNPYAKGDSISNYSVKPNEPDNKKWFLGGVILGIATAIFLF